MSRFGRSPRSQQSPSTGRASRPRWMLLTAALSACCTLLFAAPAVAAPASIAVTPTTITAGGTITISGTIPTSGSQSCPASDAAIITSTTTLFPPDGVGPRAARNQSGGFQINFLVPASLPAATYRLGLRCGKINDLEVHTSLTVTGQIQRTPSGAPTAGFGGAADGDSNLGQWLLAATILAVSAAGFAAVTVRRRQRARA